MVKDIEGASVKVKIEDELFELPKEVKEKIEEFWTKCKI